MAERLLILDPTVGAVPAAPVSLAPRLDTLDGKVIGLLDNTKLNADRFIAHFKAAMQRQFPTTEFLVRRKASASRVVAADILDELVAKCDAVIPAVGD